MGRLPVLTTFIPSITPGTPFRISIHSWEKPGPSRLMESFLQPDDALMFEARVFIDGECVAYVYRTCSYYFEEPTANLHCTLEEASSVRGQLGPMS